MPTPEVIAFKTFTMLLPAIPPHTSIDVTIAWPQMLPGDHYQVGLAGGFGVDDCVIKAQSRTAVMVTVTAREQPIRMGSPLTAAALYY